MLKPAHAISELASEPHLTRGGPGPWSGGVARGAYLVVVPVRDPPLAVLLDSKVEKEVQQPDMIVVVGS